MSSDSPFAQLHRFSTKNITAYGSSSVASQAQTSIERAERAYSFLSAIFSVTPRITVLVLDHEDWTTYTREPTYGMPHTVSIDTLVVAGQENDFWRSQIPDIPELPATYLETVRRVYQQPDGSLSASSFFQLLVIHEMAHAFHIQAGCVFPRLWLMEVFVNLCLHAYIASVEPDMLPILETLPEQVEYIPHGDIAHRSLTDFEQYYSEVGPLNYAWYQGHFHRAAKHIFDQGGITAVQQLWNTFSMTDDQVVQLLQEKTHPAVARIATTWQQ